MEENKRIDRKEYFINDNVILKPISNEEKIVHEYIIKMHEHHNSIDNICPIQDIKKFEKKDYSVFWIIYYKAEVVGFLNLVYMEQCIENTIEIHRFYIDNEYRQYGIGTQVLEKLKSLAKEKRYKGVVAKIYCNNPATNFYERNGFETYYRYMIMNIEEKFH